MSRIEFDRNPTYCGHFSRGAIMLSTGQLILGRIEKIDCLKALSRKAISVRCPQRTG